MMLLILDSNPTAAGYAIPEKLRHKQLLELMQMFSCVVDFGYKQIPQGKELKEWISRHTAWCYTFAKHLLFILPNKLSEETLNKYHCILELLRLKDQRTVIPNLKTAIFRYSSGYEGKTEYKSNTELPIGIAIEEYKKYLEWKGDKWQ